LLSCQKNTKKQNNIVDIALSSQTVVQESARIRPSTNQKQYLHSTECPNLKNIQLSFIARGGQGYTRVDEFCINPDYNSNIFKSSNFLGACESSQSAPYVVQNQYLLEPDLLSMIAEFERTQQTSIQTNSEVYTSLQGGLDSFDSHEEIQFQLNESTFCIAHLTQKEQYTYVNKSMNSFNTGSLQQAQTLLDHHIIYTVEVRESFQTITYIKNIEFTVENDYMKFTDSIYCRSKEPQISLNNSNYHFGISYLNQNQSQICILKN